MMGMDRIMAKRIARALIAAPMLALVALTGCASGFRADVARFQQLPAPQGQSFAIMAEDPAKAGGLEFAHYADLVAQHLSALGYVRAVDPAAAQLVVRLDYTVDQGHDRVETTPGGPDPFWYRPWGYGYPWYGWPRSYVYGFSDPFLFGGYNDVRSYTVYNSMLKMRIDPVGGGAAGKAVFDGTARAQSLSNKLTYLVPNLIEAMFSGFPGNNGEEIRVTVAPEGKPQAANK